MKNKIFFTIGVCVAALICAPFDASAQAKTSASTSDSPAKQSTRAIPLRGTISAVDQSAKTFTIAGKTPRVFKITDKTEMTKEGKAATMSDITENQKVTGSYWKSADGSLEAKTVKIGAMSEKKSAKEGKKTKASTSPDASPVASPKP